MAKAVFKLPFLLTVKILFLEDAIKIKHYLEKFLHLQF